VSSIKKNFVYNSLLSVSRILFPLISFPYSSRILGPDGTGKANFIDSYTQYFCLVAALGVPLYGVREVAKLKNRPAELGQLTSELLTLNFISSLFLCVVFYAVAFLTHKFSLYSTLYILGSMVLLLNSFFAEWFFQGMEQFKYVSSRSFLMNIVSIILLFVLVRTADDINWYYGITVIVLLVNVMLNMWKMKKMTSLRVKKLEYRKHLKPLFLLFSTQIAISVYAVLDKVILGYMAEDKYVGYYAAALKVAKILLTVISALSIVMMPQMSKAFEEKNSERVRSLFNKSSNFVITIGIPITAGLMCLSNEIILLLSGKEFAPASLSLQIIAPIVFMVGFSNIFGIQILTANGKESVLLRCVIIGTILNVGLNLLLIPSLKHDGAAIAILMTEAMVTVLTGYFACREIDVRFDWKQTFIVIICCLPFWLIHKLVASDNMLLTICFSVSISVLYYLLIQVFVLKNELWIENYSRIKALINERI
jgi:O-antigen/teichoic acid export membrane protein